MKFKESSVCTTACTGCMLQIELSGFHIRAHDRYYIASLFYLVAVLELLHGCGCRQKVQRTLAGGTGPTIVAACWIWSLVKSRIVVISFNCRPIGFTNLCRICGMARSVAKVIRNSLRLCPARQLVQFGLVLSKIVIAFMAEMSSTL